MRQARGTTSGAPADRGSAAACIPAARPECGADTAGRSRTTAGTARAPAVLRTGSFAGTAYVADERAVCAGVCGSGRRRVLGDPAFQWRNELCGGGFRDEDGVSGRD